MLAVSMASQRSLACQPRFQRDVLLAAEASVEAMLNFDGHDEPEAALDDHT
jgi:hypothetical protein